MAHKKGSGSTKNGRKSKPKYLGVKIFGGQFVKLGSILVRRRGVSIRPGHYVALGRDNTLYACQPGIVRYTYEKKICYASIQLLNFEKS